MNMRYVDVASRDISREKYLSESLKVICHSQTAIAIVPPSPPPRLLDKSYLVIAISVSWRYTQVVIELEE